MRKIEKAVVVALWMSICTPALVHAADPATIPLETALSDFAARDGLQLAYRTDITRGIEVKVAPRGLRPEEELKYLLEGTGLEAQKINAHTFTIRRAGAAKSGPAALEEKQDGRIQLAQAQNAAQPPPEGVPLGSAANGADAASTAQPADAQLESVVVTAQKREERLLDVPIPVTVLNTDALAQNGQVLLTEYYSQVPSFTVSPTINGAQTLTIRGINTGGLTGSNPTVGVLVDGAPYAIGAGNALPDVDPSDLARIEVLRGPQGTLYGANSMGGLINYITNDPDTRTVSGRIEANTNTVYNGAEPGFALRASANIPVSDTLAVRLSGYVRQDAGYIDNYAYNLTGVNRINTEGGRFSLLWRPTDALSINLGATYQESKAHAGSELDPALGAFQTAQLPAAGAFTEKPQIYSARIAYDFGGAKLTSISSYSSNDYFVVTEFANLGSLTPIIFPSTKPETVQYNFTEQAMHRYTQELRLESPKESRLEWLLGGFYSRGYDPLQWYMNAQDVATSATLGRFWNYQAPITVLEYAAFADITYHITDALNLQLGVRETRSQTNDSANIESGPAVSILKIAPPYTAPIAATADKFTYMVSPQYHLSHDVMAYARVATGFRPVSPNPAGAVALGAPQKVLPDTTTNYEVGVKGNFIGGMLTVDASVYYIDWRNIQIQLLTGGAANFVYTGNGAGAKSEGVELSVQLRPVRSLTLEGWLSYDDAIITRDFAFGVVGARLPFTPRWSGHLSAEEEFPLMREARGYVGVSADYQGDRTGDFPNTLGDPRQDYPSYYKLDVRAGIRHGEWNAEIYATNLNNSRGELNGGLNYNNPSYFIYIPPRTVGATLSRKF